MRKTTVATDRLLSTAEASELLGVREGTLRQWRHHNRGPASFRVGQAVKYRESTLTTWLTAQEKATTRGEVA